MEKMEKETHDFMNVESFSQLPFIRPAPVKEKGIRLFGKEFGGGDSASGIAADESDSVETSAGEETKESENGESSRKFECHYCCRNFPTSQALGGHQNAHKRERQHAKRAHLQSAMVHGAYPESHVYGIMNYHRFGAAPTPSTGYHNSWNASTNSNISAYTASHNNINYTNNNNRLGYGGHGHRSYSHQLPPINGSPLAMWRIPSVHNSAAATFNHDRSLNNIGVPLFGNDHEVKGRIMGNASDAQNRYVYDTKPSSASVKEHVSLDLHL